MTLNDAWLAPVGDARLLNQIANDASVRPWVAGPIEGELDLAPLVEDRQTICLVGAHGFSVFRQQWPFVYDWHVGVLPRGRGRWALHAGRGSLEWLFTRTVAVAVIASIPTPNRPARQLVGALGFRLAAVSPSAWPMPGGAAVSLNTYVLMRDDCEWRGPCQ